MQGIVQNQLLFFLPETPRSFFFFNYFLAISPMYMMKVFACGIHIPQQVCLEQRADGLVSHFHKIYAGAHAFLERCMWCLLE